MDAVTNRWWERELAGCVFVDARLGQRLRKLIEKMDSAIGQACRWSAKIGPTRRRPIASFPTTG